jgi:hypothetical protein
MLAANVAEKTASNQDCLRADLLRKSDARSSGLGFRSARSLSDLLIFGAPLGVCKVDFCDKSQKSLKGLDGFSGNWYWSSSEGYNNDAWAQSFSDGSQGASIKNSTYSVRAIRDL